MKKIVFGSDHAGFELKAELIRHLGGAYAITDIGTNSAESVDYPDYGKKAADIIASGEADFGVLICGSGIGISIAANRNPKARCALCHNEEAAKLSRLHNDANILALGARFITTEQAKSILDTFLTTQFEGGRHAKRVEKLS